MEVWRFITYMFVHSGYVHIASNVIGQVEMQMYVCMYPLDHLD